MSWCRIVLIYILGMITMSKAKKEKPLALPSENPKLKIKISSVKHDIIHIDGEIIARNVIVGDQIDIDISIDEKNNQITSPNEFLELLYDLNKEINVFKESTELSFTQKQQIEELLLTIKDLVNDVSLSKPKSSVITKKLCDFIKIADLLSTNIKPMISISTHATNLLIISKKIFGET
jgi:hypothetical protein